MENPRKSLPLPVTSSATQLPRLAYCDEFMYLVPTEGIRAGLVNCQSAITTMMIKRIVVRIFPLGPKIVEALLRKCSGSPECY